MGYIAMQADLTRYILKASVLRVEDQDLHVSDLRNISVTSARGHV